MPNTYLVRLDPTELWTAGRPPWEQSYWHEHAKFIDAVNSDGLLYMAGPVADFSGIYQVMQATDPQTLRMRIEQDPWIIHQLVRIHSIEEWLVLMDPRVSYESKVAKLSKNEPVN